VTFAPGQRQFPVHAWIFCPIPSFAHVPQDEDEVPVASKSQRVTVKIRPTRVLITLTDVERTRLGSVFPSAIADYFVRFGFFFLLFSGTGI
jgi:hypothetical protein